MPMIRSRALLAILLAVTFAPSRNASAGDAVEREIVVGRLTRSYLISVPSTWDGKQPIAVMFVFHGSGSDPENMVEATGFGAMAEARPAIVVYPRGLKPDQRFDVDPPAGTVSADVLFFDALLARLRARFLIDDRRVFATGFSNGAAFCYRLATDRPGVIAAIAPVAGYLPAMDRATTQMPIPLLHVHGTADERVSLPAPVATWAAWNGCRAETVQSTFVTPKGLVVRRTDYAGKTPRSDASLVLVEGIGHDWPGGEGGVASKLIYDFFFAHPRDPPPILATPPPPVPAVSSPAKPPAAR